MHSSSLALAPKGGSSTQGEGWVRPPAVCGLVYDAKTAGTKINGELANHFKRVCGNKGYSYNALRTNKQYVTTIEKKDGRLNNARKGVKHIDGDSCGLLHKGADHGDVPIPLVEEIGFDDCDYVALEASVRP